MQTIQESHISPPQKRKFAKKSRNAQIQCDTEPLNCKKKEDLMF